MAKKGARISSANISCFTGKRKMLSKEQIKLRHRKNKEREKEHRLKYPLDHLISNQKAIIIEDD